ncbi:MAG: wax ester/triacylglycerol synthase family O-acyltransferase [Acidobacteriia bacterium]|nr:wax ester/triacylglycerol synthase family O-acyltransferase [Terriglobia bacterium]
MSTTAASEQNDCLSFGDSLFLNLEREGMPLHVASLSIFEGRISLQDCIRYVESKLPLIPRYRQHVVAPPMNVGLPSWQYDRGFDIRNHVREVTLRRGTEAELRTVASRILSSTMDRARPLWDLTLLRGLKGNRTGILTRVHHSMADGLSGVGLMTVLMDSSPVRPVLPAGKRTPAPTNGQHPQSVLQCLVDSCFNAVQRVLTAESQLLNIAQHLVAAAEKEEETAVPVPALNVPFNSDTPIPSLQDLNRLLPELLGPTERLPFNIVCRGPQKFACAEIPLAQLKAVKHACGATLNDVVLALMTSAVRRYVQLHGLKIRGRRLRIVVPVSMRAKSEMGELGNHITFIPVTIPLDIRRLRSVVAAVHENVALLKSTHVAELVGLAGTLLGAIPAPFQAAIGPVASQLPLSVCNLICTNVPGPKTPLYLLGHKMLSCYPYVPIGGEMGMNCAILTYNGTAYFGFTADVHAVSDVELFPKFLRASFAELQRETGVDHPARRSHVLPTQHGSAPEMSPPAPAAKPTTPVIRFPEKVATSPEGDQKHRAIHAAIGA